MSHAVDHHLEGICPGIGGHRGAILVGAALGRLALVGAALVGGGGGRREWKVTGHGLEESAGTGPSSPAAHASKPGTDTRQRSAPLVGSMPSRAARAGEVSVHSSRATRVSRSWIQDP